MGVSVRVGLKPGCGTSGNVGMLIFNKCSVACFAVCARHWANSLLYIVSLTEFPHITLRHVLQKGKLRH